MPGRGSLAALERELPESVRSLVQRKIEALDDADRRLLGAASVQGVDFDTAIIAAALGQVRGRGRGSARAARARACAGAVRGRVGASGPDADAALPLRAPRLSQRVLRVAARDAPRAPEPGGRRAAGQRLGDTSSPATERAAGIALLFETARDNVRAARVLEPRRAGRRAAVRARRDRAARAARARTAPGSRSPSARRRRPSSICR